MGVVCPRLTGGGAPEADAGGGATSGVCGGERVENGDRGDQGEIRSLSSNKLGR